MVSSLSLIPNALDNGMFEYKHCDGQILKSNYLIPGCGDESNLLLGHDTLVNLLLKMSKPSASKCSFF